MASSSSSPSSDLLSVDRIQFAKLSQQFKQRPIVKAAISNNVLFLGRSDFSLLIGTIAGNNIEGARLVETLPHRSDDTISEIFVDTTARHVILATSAGEAIYLNTTSLKSAKISRLQGSVESVAFGRDSDLDAGSRSMLLGTTAGLIYELVIDVNHREKSCQVVCQLEQPLAITSIFFDFLGHSNTSDRINFAPGEAKRIFVLFATSSPTRLYHIFSYTFTTFKSLFEQSLSFLSHVELPGDINRAILHCYGTRTRSSNAQTFALMTESGIYHGSITFPVNKSDEAFLEAQLLPYSSTQILASYNMTQVNVPISIAPTTYHFLILTTEKQIQIINKLNGELAHMYDHQKATKNNNNNNLLLPASSARNVLASRSNVSSNNNNSTSMNGEVPLGIVIDAVLNQLYLYTDASIHAMKLVDEDRNNWRIYLKKGILTGEEVQFDNALNCCVTSENKMNVLRAKAEFNFLNGNGTAASRYLGQSLHYLSFDEAVLRILGVSPLFLDQDISQALQQLQEKTYRQKNSLIVTSSSTVPNVSNAQGKSSLKKTSASSSLTASLTMVGAPTLSSSSCLNMFGVVDNLLAETDVDETKLRVYLLEVLSHLSPLAKSQRTMLATWISELYLHEITCKLFSDTILDSNKQQSYGTSTSFGESSTMSTIKPALWDSMTSYIVNDEKMSIWDYFKQNVPSYKQSLTDMETDKLLEDEFKDFLATYRQCLDHTVTFTQIIHRGTMLSSQHGLLLYYAQTVNDYERVVSQLVTEKKYKDVIVLLNDSPLENVENLIYKLAPVLMMFEPKKTVDMLNLKPKLKPVLLLPALLQYCDVYDQNQRLHQQALSATATVASAAAATSLDPTSKIMKSLKSKTNEMVATVNLVEEHCVLNYFINYYNQVFSSLTTTGTEYDHKIIRTNTDASVYHTYVHVVCKYDNSENENCIVSALQLESDPVNEMLPMVPTGSTTLNSFVDYYFILRQCQQFKRKRGIVFSYLLLNQVVDAVNEAVSFDIELAKNIASRHVDDTVRKQLWLIIAIALLNKDNKKPQRALQLIKESQHTMTIQDLLPHLPEFTEIDLFKEEICQALEDSNARIDALKTEMQELTEASNNVAKELETMRKRGYYLTTYQRCEHCDDVLFARQFYMFPCSHGFHTDCLQQHHQQQHSFDAAQLATIHKIEESIKNLKSRSGGEDKRTQVQVEYLQNELDGYVAADCPFCGFLMIRSLGQSLLLYEAEAEKESWRL